MTATAETLPARDEIPAERRWDLTEIFSDDAAWEAAFARLEGMLPDITARQGTLGESADSLLRALRLRDEVGALLGAVYSYAHMQKDSDGTQSVAQAQDARAGSLAARVSAALAFLEPEILAIPSETLDAWRREEADLAPYAYFLDRLSREREHVRSAEVEAVIAEFGDIARAPWDAFSALTDIDLDFPTIEDEEGRPVQMAEARYGVFMQSRDRRVRRDAFDALFSAYREMATTLASTLAAAMRVDVLHARLHRYPTALAAAVARNDVPVALYHNLLAAIDANLPVLHRYMGVRRRLLGLEDLHMYDLYAPLVPQAEVQYGYEAGEDAVRAALAPLGSSYREALEEILDNRWIDVYPNVGKRSGAYSGGSYTTPPYILLNYQGRLDDVYTLIHELGHSLHSYFTRRNQPYISGNYTIFVAEVASTLNEALLTEHLLATSDDPVLRRHLLVEELEGIRTTIFRQALFAQFELDMHSRVEAGDALTADWLTARYGELMRRYYGPELTVDEVGEFEWARIPHFYMHYYVYQYATGKAAALALTQRILNEGQPAVDRYLRFLRSGSSASPVDLLRDAGVDMTTPAPVSGAMERFTTLVDRLEQEGGPA